MDWGDDGLKREAPKDEESSIHSQYGVADDFQDPLGVSQEPETATSL
jgi:hypothetical protein